MSDVHAQKVDGRYGIKTFAKTKEEFIEYYDENLTTKVAELEKERKEKMSVIKKQAVIIALVLGAGLPLGLLVRDIFNWLWIGFIIAVIYLLYLVNKGNNVMKKKLKREVVQEMVTFMNPQFTYEPNKYISQHLFLKANIFARRPDEYRGDDLIKGYVFDEEEDSRTDIMFSEVDAAIIVIKKDKEGKKRKERQPLFRGLFFKVEFNKSFGDAVTIVVPKAMKQATSWGRRRRTKKAKQSGDSRLLEDVQLEDPEFMEKFNVYSTDQVYSRVILQSDFMKKMLDFIDNKPEPLHEQDDYAENVKDMDLKGKIMHGWKVGMGAANKRKENEYLPYFSFRDDEMYFLLETNHEHFGFNMYTELNREAIYYHFKDINRALQLIDELHLNLKLYQQ